MHFLVLGLHADRLPRVLAFGAVFDEGQADLLHAKLVHAHILTWSGVLSHRRRLCLNLSLLCDLELKLSRIFCHLIALSVLRVGVILRVFRSALDVIIGCSRALRLFMLVRDQVYLFVCHLKLLGTRIELGLLIFASIETRLAILALLLLQNIVHLPFTTECFDSPEQG